MIDQIQNHEKQEQVSRLEVQQLSQMNENLQKQFSEVQFSEHKLKKEY